MNDANWRPGASLAVLKQSAQLRSVIRDYMHENHVLEVITPALSAAASTDPNIHSFCVGNQYLHTSPEFAMKRLLAAHACDIYQIASVYRDEEAGRFHNAEFSMLEWYRVGMDHLQLIDDVSSLFKRIAKSFNRDWSTPVLIPYTQAVSQVCDKDFQAISVKDINNFFVKNGRSYPDAIGDDLDAALDLLVDEFIVAEFDKDQISVVLDYPASQASLAKVNLNKDKLPVAERFEFFWGKIELANGFHELLDAGEQRSRFEKDLRIRQLRDQPEMPMDENLLQALTHGMPACAGVALGIDRLLMVLGGHEHIDEVLAFSAARA